jgi:hypothetical protein
LGHSSHSSTSAKQTSSRRPRRSGCVQTGVAWRCSSCFLGLPYKFQFLVIGANGRAERAAGARYGMAVAGGQGGRHAIGERRRRRGGGGGCIMVDVYRKFVRGGGGAVNKRVKLNKRPPKPATSHQPSEHLWSGRGSEKRPTGFRAPRRIQPFDQFSDFWCWKP